MRLPLGEYVRRSVPLPVLLQLPFGAIIFLLEFATRQPLLENFSRPKAMLLFFVEVGAALVPYVALVYAFCMSPAERQTVHKIAAKFGIKKKAAIQAAES